MEPREAVQWMRRGGKQQGAAASPAGNETVLVDDKTMILRPAKVAAYNRATSHTEEDEPTAEDTETDRKRTRAEADDLDDDDNRRQRRESTTQRAGAATSQEQQHGARRRGLDDGDQARH